MRTKHFALYLIGIRSNNYGVGVTDMAASINLLTWID